MTLLGRCRLTEWDIIGTSLLQQNATPISETTRYAIMILFPLAALDFYIGACGIVSTYYASQ